MSEVAVKADSIGAVADLLSSYVPKGEYESTLEALERVIAERDELKTQHDAHAKRAGELEGKVRDRAARDAFEKVADKLKVDPRFKEAVYKLAGIKADSDEPDSKAIERQLGEFLAEQKQFLAPPETKPKEIPAGDGSGRGTHTRPGDPELRVTRRQLADAVYMRENQSRIAAAQKAGLFVLED